MAQRVETHAAGETEALGRRLGHTLRGGEVIALYGGLGMGKTALVRGLADGMGVTGEVSSPTFALVHHYAGQVDLYHFDMYRVDGWEDLQSTGFFDYLDSGGVLAIEWSENIEGALPDDAIRIEITRGETDNDRIFEIEGAQLF